MVFNSGAGMGGYSFTEDSESRKERLVQAALLSRLYNGLDSPASLAEWCVDVANEIESLLDKED